MPSKRDEALDALLAGRAPESVFPDLRGHAVVMSVIRKLVKQAKAVPAPAAAEPRTKPLDQTVVAALVGERLAESTSTDAAGILHELRKLYDELRGLAENTASTINTHDNPVVAFGALRERVEMFGAAQAVRMLVSHLVSRLGGTRSLLEVETFLLGGPFSVLGIRASASAPEATPSSTSEEPSTIEPPVTEEVPIEDDLVPVVPAQLSKLVQGKL